MITNSPTVKFLFGGLFFTVNGAKSMKKRILFSALFAAVITIFVSQFWSNMNLSAIRENKTGRIDIYITGKNSKLEFLKNESNIAKSKTPDWCKKGDQMCVVNEFDLNQKPHNITFVAHGTGQVRVRFMGPDVKIDNIRKPIPVDYKNVSINGKNILNHRKVVWHDKPFEHKFDVKDQDVIKIVFDASRHRHHISDMGKIYGGSWLILFSLYIILFVVSIRLFGTKNKYDANFVFVAVLFGLMCVPMMHISNAEKSETENRMLATKPVIVNNQGINLKYGTQYDTWFNDRFNGRNALLRLYTSIEKHLNRYLRNKRVMMDTKTNWCFDSYTNFFRHIDIKSALQGLNALNDFAHANGAKLYVMMVPEKVELYNKHHPFAKRYPDMMFGDEIKYLTENASFPFIFPIDELRKAAKSDYVFFKTDHHWTEWGAYQGYKALLQEIKKDFPRTPVIGEDAYDIFYDRRIRADFERLFTNGTTFNKLNVKMPQNKFLDTNYRYYNPRTEIPHTISDIPKYRTKHYTNNPRGKYRVLLVGNSMSENLLQFLPYSFRELKYFRFNTVKNVAEKDELKILSRYGKEFEQYHPDIIIFVIRQLTLGRNLIDMSK